MSDNTSRMVGVKLSEDDRAIIEEEAQIESMPLATLMRSIVLKEIRTRRERRELLRQQQIRQLSAVE